MAVHSETPSRSGSRDGGSGGAGRRAFVSKSYPAPKLTMRRFAVKAL